jgi:monofunctional glycosyltransferase
MAKTKKNRFSTLRDKILGKDNSFYCNAKTALQFPINIFNKMCYWLGLCLVVITLVCSYTAYSLYSNLPTLSEMSFYELKAKADYLVRENLNDKSKKYKWVSVDKINRQYLYAIVMSEDSKYFSHDGINYDAILRSLIVNLKSKSFKSGGSTISQQVVKNLFLTKEKTIVRKIKEYFITMKLERSFTKNQILELYLNLIEVGPDIYGVNAASHNYFSKAPDEINGAEGAFVALMLPSPRKYHHSIYSNKYIGKRHRKKLERILTDMKYNEYISPQQFNSYIKYPFFTGH